MSLEPQRRSRSTQFEAALSMPIGQLILGTVPYAGGIGAFFAARVQARQVQRVEDILSSIVFELEAIRNEGRGAEDEVLESENFAHLIYSVCDDALRDGDEIRLRYLRQFVVSSTLHSRPDASWTELFRRYLTRLTGSHLMCLENVYSVQHKIPVSDRLGTRELTNVPVRLDSFVTAQYSPDLVRICLADLVNVGLLADWRLLSGNPKAMEGVSLTRNGLWFWRYIEGEWTSNLPN